jgi:hypothetical protein
MNSASLVFINIHIWRKILSYRYGLLDEIKILFVNKLVKLMNIRITNKKLDLILSKINFTNEMLAMPINIISIVKYINIELINEILVKDNLYENIKHLRNANKFYNSLEDIMNHVRQNFTFSYFAPYKSHELIILLKLFSFGEENKYMRELRSLIEYLNLNIYNEYIEDKNGNCIMCRKSCTTLLYEKLNNEKCKYLLCATCHKFLQLS